MGIQESFTGSWDEFLETTGMNTEEIDALLDEWNRFQESIDDEFPDDFDDILEEHYNATDHDDLSILLNVLTEEEQEEYGLEDYQAEYPVLAMVSELCPVD